MPPRPRSAPGRRLTLYGFPTRGPAAPPGGGAIPRPPSGAQCYDIRNRHNVKYDPPAPAPMAPAAAEAAPARDLALTSAEKAEMVLLYVAILAVTILAFAAAFAFLPHNYQGEVSGGGLIFSGLAITAYVLGVRHGFDVDHIAAIDNTTRKLLHEGKRPLTVGTWFSLGHSTIVVALIAALVVAFGFVRAQYVAFANVGAVVGTLVSGVFLFVIGLVNLLIVAEVYRIFRAFGTVSWTSDPSTSRWTSAGSSTATSVDCSRWWKPRGRSTRSGSSSALASTPPPRSSSSPSPPSSRSPALSRSGRS